ncbi:MAG: hypothetical protein V1908_01675 [Candidatus Peregrinibacteria bacterium]
MTTCIQCQSSFEVTDQDRAFYDKVSPVVGGKKYAIPEPTRCPSCREQLRLLWKNERKLYKRPCDLCKKSTISIYSADKPYTVYCRDCWWSDQWDPMSYGRGFNPNRPFFEQWNDLLLAVPKQAVHQNNNAENCEYTTSTTMNRNCYLISSAGHNEDCYYGIFMPRNKNCVDNAHIMDSQLLYECVDCDKGYNLAWCQNTKDCSDSRFLYDCHGSRHCFFSFGQRGKQYVFRNEQLSKGDYEKRLQAIDFTSHKIVESLKIEFQEFIKTHPRLYYEGQNNENVAASDHVFNSRNGAYLFDANNLEDCKFCSWYNDSKDSYDVYAFGYGNEKCYNSLEVGTNAMGVIGCISSWNNVADLFYCFACHSGQNLLGCVGLKQKKYCILNKQYSKEEYEKFAAQIIQSMQSAGEWGEFFHAQLSCFCYNETVANDFYPMNRDEVFARGWQWRDGVDEKPQASKVIPAKRLPDITADIPDDVLNWAIECEVTGRPFKLQAQELRFYREQGLPIPHLHPDERHRSRLTLRNPRTMFDRTCAKCAKTIKTSYSPERPEMVFCEACYLKAVY